MTEVTPEEEPKVEVEASVWRVSSMGLLITSVVERHAAWLAEQDPESIFFYADLESSSQLTHSEETMQKVYKALASQGLSENQIINSTNAMQNAGILFREMEF